jgi:hypothetical protein
MKSSVARKPIERVSHYRLSISSLKHRLPSQKLDTVRPLDRFQSSYGIQEFEGHELISIDNNGNFIPFRLRVEAI